MEGAGRLVSRARDNLLNEDEARETPSLADGVPEEVERAFRTFGCQLIQEMGILLKLPQVASVTAQVLFHRFYYRKSVKEFNVKQVALGAIFLASKQEECPRKLRDFIGAFHFVRCQHSNKPLTKLDVGSSDYFDTKTQLIDIEREILIQLGFHVEVEPPHKFILSYLRVLETEKNQEFAQRAWNICNDCLRTTVCVRFTAEAIATTAIYLAARYLSIALPESPPWWDLFEVSKDEIDEISYEVVQLYAGPKAAEPSSFTELSYTINLPAASGSPPSSPSSSSSSSSSSDEEEEEKEKAKAVAANGGAKEEKERNNRSRSRSKESRSRSRRSSSRSRSQDRSRNRRRSSSRSRSRSRDRRDSRRDRDRDSRDSRRDRDRDRSRERRDSRRDRDRRDSDSRRDRDRSRERERDRERRDRERGRERERERDKGDTRRKRDREDREEEEKRLREAAKATLAKKQQQQAAKEEQERESKRQKTEEDKANDTAAPAPNENKNRAKSSIPPLY